MRRPVAGAASRARKPRSNAPLTRLRSPRRLAHIGAGFAFAALVTGCYILSWVVVLDLYR